MNCTLRQPNTRQLLRDWRTEQFMLLLPFYLWINRRYSFTFSRVEEHACAARSSRRTHLLCSKRPIALSVSRKWTWKYTELAVIICEGLFKFEGSVKKKDRQTEIQMRVLYAPWARWVKPLWECVLIHVCVSVFHIVTWWCCLGQSSGVNGLNLRARDSQIVLITK